MNNLKEIRGSSDCNKLSISNIKFNLKNEIVDDQEEEQVFEPKQE